MSIKDSVHRLLGDQIEALGLSHRYEVLATEIRNKHTGSTFVFAGLSTQTIESIKSYEGIDVCWVEEGQKVSKRSWDILAPTIRKPSSEIWVTYNPELETDETHQRFAVNPPADCVSVHVNYNDNPWFPDVLEQERRHSEKYSPDDYEWIWLGRCKPAVEGAIYYKQVAEMEAEGRVRQVPYDPTLKVHAVWDLGWNDKTAIILCQRLTSEIRIIGYIEDSHRTLADYAGELQGMNLNWGYDWLPHDGYTKDVKMGKSAEEVLKATGRKVRPKGGSVPNIEVEKGIKAARLIFSRTYFDSGRTKRLVECLKRYRRSINSATNEPGLPLHDEFSHGSDAFRYLALSVDKMGNTDIGALPKLIYDNRGIV